MRDYYLILLVDDDEVDRAAARRAIRMAPLNAEVVEADNCAAALDLLQNRSFDCAFLDFQLPDGNGLEILEEMRRRHIETPVVMLTGHGDEHIAVELMKAGASDYLAKSRLSPEGLAQSLRSAIRVHKAEQYAHETERKLRESELLVREMANTAPALLWISDEEGNCTFFNQTWLEFTGRSLEQEAGKGWKASIHPEDRKRAIETFTQARASKVPFRMEYRFKRADGQYRWMLNTGTPRYSPDDAMIGYIGSCIDITERKLAEQSLQEKQAHIEQLNAHLRLIISATQDRVKNNLQLIAAMLDMQVMENPQAVPTAQLKQIGTYLHVLAVVHDLLTQQAQLGSQGDLVSAQAILSGLLPALQRQAGKHSLTFALEDVTLTANQGTTLAIIASKLVTNALAYGRNTVHLSLSIVDRQALLEVCDDGPGFPPDFDPNQVSHTGLDLIESLSHLILHGQVRYENAPEGGARVLVAIPVPKSPSA